MSAGQDETCFAGDVSEYGWSGSHLHRFTGSLPALPFGHFPSFQSLFYSSRLGCCIPGWWVYAFNGIVVAFLPLFLFFICLVK